METRHLQNFLVSVECGSISKAANIIGVSQPSLSQQLLRLEDEVGQRLLIRKSSGVDLTEAGRVFVEHAKNIIHQLELASSDLSQLKNERGGVIGLGLTNSITNLAGYHFYRLLAQKLPEVSLTLIDAMSGHIRELIASGAVNFGVLYNVDAVRGILAKEIAREQLYFIASPSFLTGNRLDMVETLDADQISRLPLSLPSSRHSLRNFIDDRMRSAGNRLRVTAELDVLSVIKLLLIGGTVCSILSLGAVWQEVEKGELIAKPIGQIDLSRRIYTARSPHVKVTGLSVKTEDLLISTIRQRLAKIDRLATLVPT